MSIICNTCDKNFTLQSNLNRHLKTVHNQTENNIISYEYDTYTNKCLEGCHSSFINIVQLRQHLTHVHKIHFEEKTLKFDSTEEFENWLLELTKTNSVQYFKSNTRKTYAGETTYYYCNRSGKYRAVANEDRKRRAKSQGTCKIGTACTSTIQVKHELGKFDVKYVASHYGHSVEIQHIRLLATVAVSRILSATRGDIQTDNLKRGESVTQLDTSVKKTQNIGVHHADTVNKDLENIFTPKSLSSQSTDEVKFPRQTVSAVEKPIRQLLKEKCLEIAHLDLNEVDDSIVECALKRQNTIFNLLTNKHICSTDDSNNVVCFPSTSTCSELSNKNIEKQLNCYSNKTNRFSKSCTVSKTYDQEMARMNFTVILEEYILTDLSLEHNYAMKSENTKIYN